MAISFFRNQQQYSSILAASGSREVGLMFRFLVAVCFLLAPSFAFGQLQFESEPINYNLAPVNDPVPKLQKQTARSN